MSRPLVRYTPSRVYLALTLAALCGAVLSAWVALRWEPSWIACALFGISAIGLAGVTLRPVIEIHETHLRIGRRLIRWGEITQVDCMRWNVPLVLQITLTDGGRFMLLYPGDAESCNTLLRDVRRYSREALLDGIPYRQFWGETRGRTEPPAIRSAKDAQAPVRYPLLRPEDEEDVERLFQKLKSVGRLESKKPDEG